MNAHVRQLIFVILICASAGVIRAEDARVVRFNASLTYETAGDYSKALEEMSALDQAAADDYLVQLRMGWLYYLNARYSESHAAYSRALQMSGGRSLEAMLGLTLPLAAQDRWIDVEAVYQKIISLDKFQYEANLRLGQIYLNRGEYAKAERYLRAVHDSYPGSYEPNLSLGWTLHYLGKHEDARTCFTRALMLSPGDTSATRGLSLMR